MDTSAISLVVTDLDGTLWHTDGSVHPETARALSELELREVPLSRASILTFYKDDIHSGFSARPRRHYVDLLSGELANSDAERRVLV